MPVMAALDERFPVATGHGYLNGGVPGTGPTYMEHCVHDHVSRDVDLVLLEYAVNTDRHPASFERLLRTVLLHPRAPALIVVNAHRWRAIRPHDGRTDKCWHKNWPVDMARNRTQWLAQTKGRTHATDMLAADEDEISSLCAHYNVPLVSMRSALVDAARLVAYVLILTARARRALARRFLTDRRIELLEGWRQRAAREGDQECGRHHVLRGVQARRGRP